MKPNPPTPSQQVKRNICRCERSRWQRSLAADSGLTLQANYCASRRLLAFDVGDKHQSRAVTRRPRAISSLLEVGLRLITAAGRARACWRRFVRRR